MDPPPSGEHLLPVPLGLRQALLSQAVAGSAARVRRVEGCVNGTQRAGASPLRLPAQTHSPGLIAAQAPGKLQQRGVLLHTRPPHVQGHRSCHGPEEPRRWDSHACGSWDGPSSEKRGQARAEES